MTTNNNAPMVESREERGNKYSKYAWGAFTVLVVAGIVGSFVTAGNPVKASELSKQKSEMTELAQEFCDAKLIELRDGMFGANMEEFNATEAGATIDLIKTDEGCFQYAGSYLYNHALNDVYPPATESLGK